MKYFSILESPNFKHPQEDYLLVSEKYPILAVADGVTLEPDKNGIYPEPSGAGQAAKIFCETAVRQIELLYENFDESCLLKVFEAANQAVGDYNRAQDRLPGKINFWDFDLFAATAALAVIKDKRVFWASMCDSYVKHFDASGNLVFKSPDCWLNTEKYLPANWSEINMNERKKIIRKVYRNGLGEKGELIGYGVVTGELAALKYLNHGQFEVSPGELVAVFTDGFENYLKLPEFLKIFTAWPADLEATIKNFTAIKARESLGKFGLERSLIVAKF